MSTDASPRSGPEAADSRTDTLAERLAFARACQLIARGLPATPARVALIGSPAAYEAWLRGQGYSLSVHPDAESLPLEDASQDAALLLGPLQRRHSTSERHQVLSEARRVLKPGAILIATAYSRFAWLLDGLWQGHFADPAFAEAARTRIESGAPFTPPQASEYAQGCFHRPEELQAELRAAGLVQAAVIGLEGPAWLLPEASQARALAWPLTELLDAVDHEPEMMGMSRHLLATGFRPA